MELKFCRRCGATLKKTKKDLYRCQSGHTIFLNSAPTASIFFIDNDEVILAIRRFEPYKGALDSLGDFLNPGENFEQAAKRELLEETSLTDSDYSTLHYLCSGNIDYLYENEQNPVVTAIFVCKLNPGAKIKPADDVAEIVKLPIKEINPDDIPMNDIKAGIIKLQELHANGRLEDLLNE